MSYNNVIFAYIYRYIDLIYKRGWRDHFKRPIGDEEVEEEDMGQSSPECVSYGSGNVRLDRMTFPPTLIFNSPHEEEKDGIDRTLWWAEKKKRIGLVMSQDDTWDTLDKDRDDN